jgi:hypothetical protein
MASSGSTDTKFLLWWYEFDHRSWGSSVGEIQLSLDRLEAGLATQGVEERICFQIPMACCGAHDAQKVAAG